MIKFLQFILKSTLYFILFWTALNYFYLSGWEIDLSKRNGIQQWINKEFILKKDIFVYQYSNTKDYSVSLPGSNGRVPASVEDYLSDPEHWQYTDQKAKLGWGKQNGVIKANWVHLVKAGTHFKIESIKCFTKPLVIDYLLLNTKIIDPELKDIKVNMSDFFPHEYDYSGKQDSFLIHGIKEEVIEEITPKLS